MRKFSILLLLISIPFMAMEYSSPSIRKTKITNWHYNRKTVIPIPIEATVVEAILDENYIEVRFMENVDNQVIFQVKDLYGNIMWQEVTIPNKEEIFTINLPSIEAGQYELLYIEKDSTLIGEFEIRNSIP